MSINKDVERFKKIVKGQIKRDLKKFVSSDDFVKRKGKDKVSISIPRIDLPRFKFGSNNGGVGSGDGGKKPGDEEGDNPLELEVSLEELANVLQENLKLPNIKPNTNGQVMSYNDDYNTVSKNGPESLRSFRYSFKESLKRSIASGDYDPKNPLIIPIKEDTRYKDSVPIPQPENKAAIIYVMDVSSSMGQKEKDLARKTGFWIDLWLSSQYKNIENRYIIHHVKAREVDKNTFFRTREGGGTCIYSAYNLIMDMLKADFAAPDWNLYVFQFSDGDDFKPDESLRVLNKILPRINQFNYCQVTESGLFNKVLRNVELPHFCKTIISEPENILAGIREFFKDGA